MTNSLPVSTASPAELVHFLESGPLPTFLVVYSSLRESDGLMWCGDCREAEGMVSEALRGREGSVRVVMVGGKSEWRDPSNPFRKSPFLITALPTIIKVTEHAEEKNCCVDGQCGIDEEADETVWSRLVEEDCYDKEKLLEFLESGEKGDRR